MNLTEKLMEVQKKLKAPKGQWNKFSSFHYRSAEDILEAVKPINAEHGLLLTLTDEPVLIGDWHYIKAAATITDGETSHVVSAYARESLEKKGMDDSQITGTASSYARKYALNGLYLIDDTEDADTDEFAKQSQKKDGKQSGKASEKQLNFINKMLKDKSTEKHDSKQLYQILKKKMNTNSEMENWTPSQASQAIKILQGDNS